MSTYRRTLKPGQRVVITYLDRIDDATPVREHLTVVKHSEPLLEVERRQRRTFNLRSLRVVSVEGE